MKNREIKVLLSAPRGFCAGVERAIEIVQKSIKKYGAPVYVRHEIVHNKHVVDSLKAIGAIDLIQDEHDVELYKLDNNKKIAYVTQTTLSVDDTKNIIKALKKKFPQIKEPFKEDICYATTNRQSAVKNIAKQCDMFFVLGSRNSSNSVRLVEVAEQTGCPHAELIHSESEIPFEKIQNCKTIGVSSGASAPEVLVENFINKLKDNFKIKIEEVEIIKENIVFKVPAKLN